MPPLMVSRARHYLCAVLLIIAGMPATAQHAPTIEDSIAMERFQARVTPDQRVGAFSPDGRQIAFVTWHGDLESNLNVYSLRLLNLDASAQSLGRMRTLATRSFTGDPDDPHASPFEQVRFETDGSTITYLGRAADGHQQVFAIDIRSDAVVQGTRSATSVRSFVTDGAGRVLAYSALALSPGEAERRTRIDGDGVFLWDEANFYSADTWRAGGVIRDSPRYIRDYFIATNLGPRKIYSSAASRVAGAGRGAAAVERGFSRQIHEEVWLADWETFSGDPTGRWALLYPFGSGDNRQSRARSATDTPYGLVDLRKGTIAPFIDALRPMYNRRGGATPLWSPDGRSVLIFSRASLGSREVEREPQWLEIDVATRRVTPVPALEAMAPIGWQQHRDCLIASDDQRFVRLCRNGARWLREGEAQVVAGTNWRYRAASNGNVVIAVAERQGVPPQLVLVDIATGERTILTGFNPDLQQRRHAPSEAFTWRAELSEGRGILIRPHGHEVGRRYPLVILLDDGTLRDQSDPYLLDGVGQLTGHSAQMLAARGFMVLYTMEPRSRAGVGECELMSDYIDAAIDALDSQAMIDPARVGISGWSRAGYHVECVLRFGRHRLAAASRMDGGGREFRPFRPFTDSELRAIQTPLLIQSQQGPGNLALHTEMADRLTTFGTPVEVLYFATSSHVTTRPQHRFRSMTVHIDWWSFWLQGEEDPAQGKATQFARWRELQRRQRAILPQPRQSGASPSQ